MAHTGGGRQGPVFCSQQCHWPLQGPGHSFPLLTLHVFFSVLGDSQTKCSLWTILVLLTLTPGKDRFFGYSFVAIIHIPHNLLI